MNHNPERVFETFEPPPGGLARLRERIDRRMGWRARVRYVPAATAASLLVALVSWTAFNPGGRPAPPPAELDLIRMHLGLLASPSETLTIPVDQRSTTAIRRVPLPTDQVVFYMVGSIRD